MENYLQGYLDVLPEYQRKKIEDIIKDNESLYTQNIVSESEFKAMIDQLALEHQPLTAYLPQEDRLDPVLYNTFFSNVYIDLNLLFIESLLIENATANYERIFDGIIADLDREMKRLRERVESLKLVGEGEDGILVEKRSFESATEMEDPAKFPSLFVDRDGSAAPSASFDRRHDEYFIALRKTKETDALRQNGETTAQIAIQDWRGMPISFSKYPIAHAIDADPESYWAEVVLADEPIQAPMKKG